MESYVNKVVNGVIVPKSRPDLPGNGTQPTNISQCVVCKEVFSTPGNYEKHRYLYDKRNYKRVCRDPETVGLEIGKNNTWVTIGGAEHWTKDDSSS